MKSFSCRHLLSYLRRIRLKSPERCELVIFDQSASDVIIKTVLNGRPHAILPCWFESFFVSVPVFFRFMVNLRLINAKGIDSRFSRSVLRRMPARLYRLYLMSCIQQMKPKVVLTFVDDNPFFHFISRHYPAASFYPIVNGLRFQDPVVPGTTHYQVSMPDLICYGPFEAEFYRRLGHDIDRFHFYAAVQSSYYRHEVAPHEDGGTRHDICLVSQYFPKIMDRSEHPEIRRALLTQDRMLSRYLRENDLRCCVAMRGESEEETAYFRSVYGGRALLKPNRRLSFSTYRAMRRSDVIVVFHSNAGIEAYGWGKKVLFTNFSGTAYHRVPVEDFNMVDEEDYEIFSRKLDAVRLMDEGQYQSLSARNRGWVVPNDPEKPAHLSVREMIDARLG